MLNIPEAIKMLYQQDSIQKNFRVVFPNGELPDITNKDVVSESVTFTESLCSQEVLKFGLTEAPTIEFETVGVDNMYGMTIQCFNEIDTSSLSAEDIADIQAMTDLDGELVLEADSDIGYGFYRVPLGVFRVNSCPRNNGQMTHRVVNATSVVREWAWSSNSEGLKRILTTPVDIKKPIYIPIRILVADFAPKSFIQEDYWEIRPSVDQTNTYTMRYFLGGGSIGGRTVSEYFVAKITCYEYNLSANANSYTTAQIKVDYSNMKERVSSLFEAAVQDYEDHTPTGSISTEIYETIKGLFNQYGHGRVMVCSDKAGYYYDVYSAVNSSSYYTGETIPLTVGDTYDTDTDFTDNYTDVLIEDSAGECHSTIWNYRNSIRNTASRSTGREAKSYIKLQRILSEELTHETFWSDGTHTVDETYSTRTLEYDPADDVLGYCRQVSYPSNEYDAVKIDRTITEKKVARKKAKLKLIQQGGGTLPSVYQVTSITNVKRTEYTCKDDILTELADVVNDYFEVIAGFGDADRYGNFIFRRLSQQASVIVPPSLIKELWWEEYDISPIGSAIVPYKLKDKEDAEHIFEFGDGDSQYEFGDNKFFDYVSKLDSEKIETILNDGFVENSEYALFTPVEAIIKGLPYIEVGDNISAVNGYYGSNLFRGTSRPAIGAGTWDSRTWTTIGEGTFSIEQMANTTPKKWACRIAPGGSSENLYYKQTGIPAKPGTSYTLSFRTRMVGSGSPVVIRALLTDVSGGAKFITVGAVSPGVAQRLSATFETYSTARQEYIDLAIGVFRASGSYEYIDFYDLMLNEGDTAEAWSGEDIVNTYVLRRTMSGVQSLMDSIESVGGEIVDEINEEEEVETDGA